ncbi:hypothetical protein K435DRAFT_774605 [Dendrothele bispora CBS 962.96]|uniref:Yeast cell wall synthesis Kre9/Knh1-like N-terminal domain-containing protein n=1 Tax=Dendrothele bispora (strain CBS 962.96) TaxID=1314807 RepID=A0A4S8MMP1_DENBC|nr:hypothetical protein K435DRAFT_774605 [Dendrothele bispora CBS 962.96]
MRLTAFFATIAAIVSVNAIAVPRDVWVPRIISPDSTTVWTMGQTVNVTWDNSNPPAVITKGSAVALNKADIPIPKYNQPGGFLAEDFDLLTGFVEVTVPTDLESADDYSITLFGDSGNRSPMFTITN